MKSRQGDRLMSDTEMIKKIYRSIEDNNQDQAIGMLKDRPDLLNQKTHLGSWLHQAAINGQLDLIRRLLEIGIDVNIEGFDNEGFALSTAASKGHLHVLQYLHEQGGIFDTSESQRNPLIRAIITGKIEAARYLIEQGIDVTPRYKVGGMTDMDALKFAQHWGRAEIAKLIEQRLKTL